MLYHMNEAEFNRAMLQDYLDVAAEPVMIVRVEDIMITKIGSIKYHAYADNIALKSALEKLAEVTNNARIWLNSLSSEHYIKAKNQELYWRKNQ